MKTALPSHLISLRIMISHSGSKDSPLYSPLTALEEEGAGITPYSMTRIHGKVRHLTLKDIEVNFIKKVAV